MLTPPTTLLLGVVAFGVLAYVHRTTRWRRLRALFSGGLYALVLGSPRLIGAITSLGGLCLIAGGCSGGRSLALQDSTGATIQGMRHRHLNHDRLTPAAVDAIIQRGLLTDWVRLATAVRGQPGGEIAATIRRVCEARRIDSEAPRQSYVFWRHYLDHHRL